MLRPGFAPPPARTTAAVAALLTLAALAALPGAPDARAARPMITDDARVVDPKTCQLETWARHNRGGPNELWAVPSCNFGGDLEIAVGGAIAHDSGSATVSDTLAQVKYLPRPLKADDWGWGITLGGASNARINPRANQIDNLYLNLPASLSLRDDAILLHANVGALHDTHERRTRATWGLGSEILLRGDVQLIAETFGEAGARPFLHGGLRIWLVRNRVQVDTTVGTRAGAWGEQRWFTVGLRLLSPPFLP
jgi:hypothetical protein